MRREKKRCETEKLTLRLSETSKGVAEGIASKGGISRENGVQYEVKGVFQQCLVVSNAANGLTE